MVDPQAPNLPRTQEFRVLRNAVRMFVLCGAVAAALLTFPQAVPWMIAFWLLCYSVATVRGGRGWLPLVLCAGVVLVKRIPWSVELGILAAVAIAVYAGNEFARRAGAVRWRRRFALAGAAVVWVAWCGMALDWYMATHSKHRSALKGFGPVVCLGDSLTLMDEAKGGYPEQLNAMVRLPVINLGEAGIETKKGIAKLPWILALRPQTVVIELGGNDFNNGRSRRSTKENLETLIRACREIDAEVILVEIPRGYMTDPYAGIERELAREYDLELVPDSVIRRMLLSSPVLPPGMWLGGPYLTQADGLHPNERGNEYLARRIADSLEFLYGPEIRRRN